MQITVLLLLAGKGKRLGAPLPKQYLDIEGEPLLMHCLRSLAQEPRFVAVQPVIAADDPYFARAVAKYDLNMKLLPPVQGGAVRALSMARGLAALAPDVRWVAVHDAARPLPPKAMLARLVDAAAEHGAAVPGLPVTDTIKRVDEHGFVVDTPPRNALRAVQTPQLARREWFDAAVAAAGERLEGFTDDASLLEAAGFSVYVVAGDRRNRKITTQEDVVWLKQQLRKARA